jgi:hypothetical protein
MQLRMSNPWQGALLVLAPKCNHLPASCSRLTCMTADGTASGQS